MTENNGNDTNAEQQPQQPMQQQPQQQPQQQQPQQPQQQQPQQPMQQQPQQQVIIQQQANMGGMGMGVSDKKKVTVLLLAIFLGAIGVHRFYTGHTMTGLIQLLTLGGCGIWALLDIITIATGGFKDAIGRPLAD